MNKDSQEIDIDEAVKSAKLKTSLGENEEEDLATARLQHKEKLAEEADRRYKRLLKQKALEAAIVDQFQEHLDDMLGEGRLCFKIGKPIVPPRRSGKPEHAVLFISDSHAGRIVKPEETLNFGCYNPFVYCSRLKHLENTVISLLRHNIVNPVERLHLFFLGDLVDGLLEHGAEIEPRIEVADQVLLATCTFFQMIAAISRVVPVTVRGVVGNHGRVNPKSKKTPTDGTYSNWDFVVMSQLELLSKFSNLDRVTFELDINATQVTDICGYKWMTMHGHELRGGDKALGICSHAMAKQISSSAQRYGARLANGIQRGTIQDLQSVKENLAPDFFVAAHRHFHASAATARGRFVFNGSFFTDDNYALASNFSPDRPHQMFCGVHEDIGRSWLYDIYLDIAPSLNSLPYVLPERLAKKVSSYK
jgi:hypothetical protein